MMIAPSFDTPSWYSDLPNGGVADVVSVKKKHLLASERIKWPRTNGAYYHSLKDILLHFNTVVLLCSVLLLVQCTIYPFSADVIKTIY